MKLQLILLKALMFFMICSFTLPAFAADWAVSWTGTDGKHHSQTIDDEQEFEFTAVKFPCWVSKMNLSKVYKEIFERRTLSCWITKDTVVSTYLSYNVRSKDYMDERSLMIDNNGKKSVVMLIVVVK